MSTTAYGLGFEPFPLLLDYELCEHLMLRTDATKSAMFLGSHMNGEIADMSEALEEYEEAGHSAEDVYAEEERLWRELCSRLITGESDCCEAMSRFYDSLIIDYSTDERAREWLQSKGLHLPVVPLSEEPDSNESALLDFAPGLGDDYLEQLNDLFWLYPGFTEDGKPCVWVNPGRWREVRVLLRPEDYEHAAHFQMMLWDWDMDGGFFYDPEVIALARDTWVTDGFLDHTEVYHSYGVGRSWQEKKHHIPDDALKELRRGLDLAGVYGQNTKLDSCVEVLGSADDLDFELDTYGDVVCKAVVRVG